MKMLLFLLFFVTAIIFPQRLFAVDENTVDAAALLTDSDGDGYSDVLELMSGYDPQSSSIIPLLKTIKVSLKEQRLRYYTGKYLVKEIKISSGLPSKPTPKGSFMIDKKMPSHLYAGEGYFYPNTKWNLRFKYNKSGSYYIHGAYWHNAFGTPRSHGCINVAYKDVETLYNWAPMGTSVTIE